MCSRRLSKFIGLLPIALVLMLSLRPVSGFGETPLSSLASAVSPYGQPTFSDFDRDNRVDRAELSSDGPLKRVYLSFGKSAWKALSFDSGVADRGRLISEDVDNDGDIDLLWISQSRPLKLVMWLGDGHGNFSRASDLETNFGRLQTLLRDGHPGLSDNSAARWLACILLTAGQAGPPVVAKRNHIYSSKQSLPSTGTLALLAPFRSDLQQRGPPSLVS